MLTLGAEETLLEEETHRWLMQATGRHPSTADRPTTAAILSGPYTS
jgi:hypothetical protein